MSPRPTTTRRKRRAAKRPTRRFSTLGFWAGLLIVILLVAYVQVTIASQPHPSGERIDFSNFVSLAEEGRITKSRILDQDSYVEGTYRGRGGRLAQFNTPFLKSEVSRINLVQVLQNNQVPLKINQQIAKTVYPTLSVLLPTLILIVVFGYAIISARSGAGLFSTRSGSRRATEDEITLRFDDAAAQDTAVAELRELTQFLVDPERFTQLGARIPKGVLLYGPPCCGKTLLASAVAGEAGAAFYSISGSDFVEMYV
ncbi:MAG: ATP-dependent metallopeptidase FtsH/Yme1/Tma family protein, partial [Solirubrobacteraceae bacterium]